MIMTGCGPWIGRSCIKIQTVYMFDAHNSHIKISVNMTRCKAVLNFGVSKQSSSASGIQGQWKGSLWSGSPVPIATHSVRIHHEPHKDPAHCKEQKAYCVDQVYKVMYVIS